MLIYLTMCGSNADSSKFELLYKNYKASMFKIANASTVSVSGSYYVKKGYDYRLKTKFYVYSDGELKETINNTYDYGHF
ncbi:conserved protein of unknown function [Tepidanaerobacter acetatoxydans Re1]|uniref:Uncharacterized protein n=1 Tax=Tepidanaerobacter acetatoxydans (strain DSM 21804 / JCM 16047 / Re1) TaxID=1209989 RepID=F4LX20_TEPAE|nr:hypothetical protein [Tepidanaerobacter acetatoxydans]AEE90998.1 hypothetical protein TepRe1_0817 [Tepidanaerobacter acetatoxydans Re1]CCP25603.1 conserved protein of unknown function [Tepidanaerobacter acetatoxydans Re1]